MTKTRKSNDDEEKTIKETIQKRFKSIFSGKGQPLSNMSIQEVEALQARVAEAEAKLANQSQLEKTASTISQESVPQSAVPELEKDVPANVTIQPVIQKNANRRFGLGTKVPLIVIGILTFAFLVATVLSVWISRTALVKTLKETLMLQTASQTEIIRSHLIWTRSMAVDLAAAAGVTDYSEETILKIIESTLAQNNQVVGSTIAYEPYQFDPTMRYWAPYYNRLDDGSLQFTQLGTPENNYHAQDWYRLAKEANRIILSPPYFDIGGAKIWMVTWSVPFFDADGGLKGVATTDIAFSQTQQIVRQIEVGQKGYAFLIDSQGTILGIGDNGGTYQIMVDSMLSSPTSSEAKTWTDLVQSMMKGSSGFAEVTDPQGQPMFVAYEPIGLDTGWSLGLAFPQTELFRPATQLQNTLIIFAIAVVIVFAVVLYFFTRSITRPLQRLAYYAAGLARREFRLMHGKLAEPIQLKTHDEIEDLAHAFNHMATEVALAFEKLEERVVERTHDLELASEVGRTATEKVMDLSEMLMDVAEMIRSRFDLYYTQIYLTDPAGQKLTLRAGTGEVGKELLQRGHSLTISTGSLNGRAVIEKEAQVVADTRESPGFMPNRLLPNTQSEMCVPLIVSGKVVGVLDVQSERPGALSESNLPAFQALAGQLAIAIQNTVLFAEVQEARAEVESQVRRLTEQGWGDFLNAIDRGEKIGFAFEHSEIVRLQPATLTKEDRGLSIPLNVTGTKVGEIHLPIQPDQSWTDKELELIQATGAQLAQHVENLRLLAQAERYRAEAEQALQRLTHQGWDAFLKNHNRLEPGYVFDLTEVRPLSAQSNGHSDHAIRQPMSVGNQVIGELAVHVPGRSEEAAEVIAAVAEQLSSHIENLRLSELNEQHAQRERTLRQITSALRSSNNPATIMRTAVRELGTILGRRTVVQLASPQAVQIKSCPDNENESDAAAYPG
ncbi:MAG TPA: GAF domain-containing protein [Anaerolineales bacterium]|nr:GAF domain-containing protein [Anaerolineales bacterium]